MSQSWYNAERVRQPGSVVLNTWMAEREAARVKAMKLSEGWGGSELYEVLTGGMSASAGVAVNAETAKRVSAVYACVTRIACPVSTLPIHVYRRKPEGRERDENAALWYLLNEQPGPCWTAQNFWEYLLASKLLRGDGMARILRSANGVPTGFEPLKYGEVIRRKVNGRLRFDVYPSEGDPYGLDQDDVIHLPGFGFDGQDGESVIRHAARNAVGNALAADEYSGSFFANGARPDFVLQADGNLSDATADLVRKTWGERHQGVKKAHLPAVLTNGLKVAQVTMSAEDAQLLDTRKFQVIDIARAFGVPPHMIGETSGATSWGSGIEQMSIAFVRYTLTQHITQIEQELNRKLFRTAGRFVEFNRDALMAGDSSAESQYFTKALGGPGQQGWMTVNEVRRVKNLPPLEGGDQLIFSGAGNEA